MADGTLIFDTKIDQSGFNSGATSIKKMGNSLVGSFAKFGAQIAGALGIGKILKDAISTASDLQEVQNVVDVSFGSMANRMEDFAKTSLKAFGMSQLEAKRTGSTFMAMASGIGIAQESASDMSLTLTGLAGDMASFFNKDVAETSSALKSIFTGNAIALTQYGIVMTATNLEQFRLEQGITKSYQAMTQAEKVQLRYNYVLQQTALAQGDFARTSGSWANQIKLLKESFKEFLSIIGTGLIKVLTPVVQMLNVAVGKLIDFANAVAKVFGGSQLQATQQQAQAIQGTVDAEEELEDAIKGVDKANKKSVAGFDTIMQITEITSEAQGGGLPGGGAAGIDIAPYTSAIDEIGEADTSKFEQALERIKAKIEEIKNYFMQFASPFNAWLTDVQNFGDAVSELGNTVFSGLKETFSIVFADLGELATPLINTLLTDILPVLTQIATELVKTLTTIFSTLNGLFQSVWSGGIKPLLDTLVKIWSSAWNTIHGFWEKWGTPIFENIRTALEKAGDVLQNIWDTILQPVWTKFMEVIDEVWTNHLQPLLDNFLDFVGELVNGALKIYNEVIAPIVSWLVDLIGPTVSNIVGTAVDLIGTAIGTIIDIINSIITVLKGIVEFIVGVFTGDLEKALEGTKTAWQGVWDGIVAIVKGAINLVIGFINGMLEAIETGINRVIKMVNSLSFDVPEWVPGIGGQKFGFDLKPVTFARIPKLATGTVLPGGNPYMAIVNDQPRGQTNVEAPLTTIKEALIQALQEYGTQDLVADVVVNWNGEEVYNQIEKVKARRGTRIVRGGVR